MQLHGKQATHGLWSSAGLQMPVHTQFYQPAIWTSKVGQGDLVFDLRSGIASMSVRARLQVSAYSGYDLYHPGCPKIDAYILTPWPWKVGQTPRYSTSMLHAPKMQI